MSRYEELLRRATAARQPVDAHLELTRRCTLECTMCYQTDPGGEAELTTTEWGDVVEQLADLGVLVVTLSGGEPLLRDDALAIARRVRQLGLSFRLATSGTRLDEDTCRALAELHPFRVDVTVFSLDPATHDGVTRRPGSLVLTLDGIRRLRALDVRVLVNTPLLRAAWRGWQAVEAFAREVGAGHGVSPVLFMRDDGDRGPLRERLTPAEIAEFYAQSRIRAAPAQPRLPDEPTCRAGIAFIVIGPRGEVRPCVSLPGSIGSVRRDRLRHLWENHPALELLRSTAIRDLAACRSCAKSGYCGRCPAMALLEDGEFRGPSSFACALAAAKEPAGP